MVRQNRYLPAALMLLALTSCQGAKEAMGSDSDSEPPKEWQIDAISEAVTSPDGDQFSGGKPHILAWKVRQDDRDDRPFTVEDCLVLRHFGSAKEERWVLAVVYRHPPKPQWHLSQVQYLMPTEGDIPRHCVWVTHCQTYVKRPTNKEVSAFVERFGWGLEPGAGWRLLRSGVCRNAWQMVIGEDPTRLFAELEESKKMQQGNP